jgi:hypothetical protein
MRKLFVVVERAKDAILQKLADIAKSERSPQEIERQEPCNRPVCVIQITDLGIVGADNG